MQKINGFKDLFRLRKMNTKNIVTLALFIALQIICTRFLTVTTPVVRIGFGFLPLAICAMLYGPIWGGISAAIADIIGMMLFPQGSFFIGFTISAFLSAFVYGILLYNQTKTLVRVTIAVLIVLLVIDLGINTYWLKLILNKGFIALLPARLAKTTIMPFIQIPLILTVWKLVGSTTD